MRRWRGCVVLAMVLGCARPGSADVLVFKDGRRMEGVATPRGDRVELRVAEGHMVFHRDLIARIITGVTPLQQYEKQRAALTPGDIEGRFRLARFCESKRLRQQARQELTTILAQKPDHEGARQLMGFRRYNGRWMTADEEMAARGMVRVGSRWMTQAEATVELERQRVQKQAAAREQAARYQASLAAYRHVQDQARIRELDEKLRLETAARQAAEAAGSAAAAARSRDEEQWGLNRQPFRR